MGSRSDTSDPRVHALVNGLLAERGGSDTAEELASTFGSARLALRALMNVRAPAPLDPAWLALQDEFLSEENAVRALTPPMPQRLSVWRGEITRLRVDAIVNAANSALLGCFEPLHICIDNAIHSAAGLQLRAECDRIMKDERLPTGPVAMTPAYNLSSRFVLHTVGPIISGPLTPEHKALLARCYDSILEAAAEHSMRSITLCSISTGVFGFPKEPAAKIAVERVRMFCASSALPEHVVFCVFSKADEAIYRNLLQ